MAGRIQQGYERIKHSLPEAFDENSRKRSAPTEPTDGLSDAKRQRLGAQVPPFNQHAQPNQPPPLPPGPVSYAQLFTLTQEQGLKGFDVNVIPLNILQSIVVPLLASIDHAKMDQAINVCTPFLLPPPHSCMPSSVCGRFIESLRPVRCARIEDHVTNSPYSTPYTHMHGQS